MIIDRAYGYESYLFDSPRCSSAQAPTWCRISQNIYEAEVSIGSVMSQSMIYITNSQRLTKITLQD